MLLAWMYNIQLYCITNPRNRLQDSSAGKLFSKVVAERFRPKWEPEPERFLGEERSDGCWY
jgi:hypothetical protein